MPEELKDPIRELEAILKGKDGGRADPWATFNTAKAPLHVCVTGVELNRDEVEIIPGIMLRKVFVDMFDSPMMAFGPPPVPKAPHPGPWASVRGGFQFESRLEVEIRDAGIPDGFTASLAAWLVVAVLRLQVRAPIRAAAIGNMPFMEMGPRYREAAALAFEAAPHQWGLFHERSVVLTDEDLAWLLFCPVAARLYHDPRFFRALSVYDEAQWCRTKELGTVLIWSALEALFDLGLEQSKTRAISRALSDYVADTPQDRDHAYGVIRDLYMKRGSVVHVGKNVTDHDFMQSAQLARAAFRRVLIDGTLPVRPAESMH